MTNFLPCGLFIQTPLRRLLLISAEQILPHHAMTILSLARNTTSRIVFSLSIFVLCLSFTPAFAATTSAGYFLNVEESFAKELATKELTAKELLSKESLNFTAIDNYAQRVPQHIASQSIPKLVAYLTKPATNDIEKARAIARWITSNVAFDFEAASNEKYRPSDNADSVFLNRHALESGFAALFVRMMHAAGVETFAINGLKKGFNFAPGDASTLKRHTWNAFRTGGKWYLVDLPVYKEVETDGSYKLAYADAFFCIQPEQMVFTNFPDDKRWQLLNEPITKEQFITSVQCFGAYHGYLITPVSHRDYEIFSKPRSLTLSFDAPPALQLGARVYAEKGAKEQHASVKTQREGRKFTVHVRFPAEGTFKLEITATELIRERGTSEVVGCSIKTVAEYNVNIGDKQPRSMAIISK